MEYFVLSVILGAVGYWAYQKTTKTTPVIKSTPKPTSKKITKISKPVLSKLTKAQLAEKGKQLGVAVDTKKLKKDINMQV